MFETLKPGAEVKRLWVMGIVTSLIGLVGVLARLI
jgi:hypothetical protein